MILLVHSLRSTLSVQWKEMRERKLHILRLFSAMNAHTASTLAPLKSLELNAACNSIYVDTRCARTHALLFEMHSSAFYLSVWHIVYIFLCICFSSLPSLVAFFPFFFAFTSASANTDGRKIRNVHVHLCMQRSHNIMRCCIQFKS